MALIDLINVDFSVGGPLLLEQVNLSIEARERIAIIGRNGAGKSTLMKIINGSVKADDGQVRINTQVATLAQEVPHDTHGSIEEVVAGGLGELGHYISRYHELLHTDFDPDELASVQHAIENSNGWALEARISSVLQRLSLDPDVQFAGLSGGMKRRVMLAQALVQAPQILLLDEPTNHLDTDSILWLEAFLQSFEGSVIFVTHDRSFLRNLATRIIEIDRGKVTSWPGDYDNYLRRREERLHAQAQENALFDKKLANEEVWIRQGIKARRTRNEGRVRALKEMRKERAERRELQGNVRLASAKADASGKRVVETENISLAFGDKKIVTNLSTVLQRGDRLGIIGANGSGKTTLIKLLLGELAPDSGIVKLGSNLQVAYFDQLRGQLNDDLNALDNIAEGREYVELNGSRKHILGYLQDFLFSPERARAPITRLSGGERHRLLLAKIFLKPANVLVLDEPSNDLDLETLDLLEELLADYHGTVILVSHDREFLDNIVTSSLVLQGDGSVIEVAGGYSDWLRERAEELAAKAIRVDKPTAVESSAKSEAKKEKRKMSFKEVKELEELPASIEKMEAEQRALAEAMNDPVFFKQDAASTSLHQQKIATLTKQLERTYARWEELTELEAQSSR